MKNKKLLFSQYQLCVEMADRISQRRGHANNFYHVCVGVIFGTVLNSFTVEKLYFKRMLLAVFCILGCVLCIIWMIQIQSYKNLNSAKFKVILKLEETLPFSVRAYSEEWSILRGSQPRKYRILSKVESYVPLVWLLFFLVILVIPFCCRL